MSLTKERRAEISAAINRVLNERITANRFTLKPIGICDPGCQLEASDEVIFTLHKGVSSYYLLPVVPGGGPFLPLLDGPFLYVVLADDPFNIYCSTPSGDVFDLKNGYVDGHTSLSKRTKVLYAGELHFLRGYLIRWNNASGHYKPHTDLARRNITPYLRRLLPDALFEPLDFNEVGSSRRTFGVGISKAALLAQRGYTALNAFEK